MDNYEEHHKGRISGSRVGCPRMIGLIMMGKERNLISERLRKIFDIGQEYDEVMKDEADEEFPDFEAPETEIFKFRRGSTIAEVALTPDGLRKDEVIEFKGLSPNNYNAIRTEEDLRDGSPLFQKYWNQVQIYAGAFKKRWIRFRVKNKRTQKSKDIRFKANPQEFTRIKNLIMDVKEKVDKGELPEIHCSGKEMKFCSYSKACVDARADSVSTRKLTKTGKEKIEGLADKIIDLQDQIDPVKHEIENLRDEVRKLMARYGQRSFQSKKAKVAYGIRYRTSPNKDDIQKLIESEQIRTEEVGSEYLTLTRVQED